MICILDKGLIVNVLKDGMREIATMPSDSTTWGVIKNTKEINFYLFYLVLQQHLNTAINFPPNLLKYAEATHAIDNIQIMIPKNMIPDDMFIEAGKTKFSGEDMKFLAENQQILFKLLTNQMTENEFQKTGKTIEDIKGISERFVSLIQRSFGVTPIIPDCQKDLD